MPRVETSIHALRSRAEALLPDYPAGQFGPGAAPEDLDTLLRELRLHEIELELQNASLRDIQLELEQSHAKLRELYDRVPTPHLRLAEDSTILDANDAALALLASTREAAVGRRISRWVNTDDVTTFEQHRRSLAGADSNVTSYLALDIGDARREVRLESIRARDGSSESLTTITELGDSPRSSPALEADAFAATILDAAGLMAVLDLRGRIVQLNRGCSALLDDSGAATGRELWEVFATSPEQRALARECLSAAVAQRSSPVWEGAFVAPNGVQRHVTWSLATVAGKATPVSYVIATGNDVTSVKALRAQLVVAERLAAIGQLAAGVGHEINNPLAYVKSSLELAAALLNKLPEEHPKLGHMIDVAQEGAERIRLIVEDLRVLSSHDVHSVDAIDVRELLKSCVQLASNEISHRARLVVDYGHVPRVMANAGRLSQVFLNLLVNAAQSIGQGHGGSNEIGLRTRTGADGGVVVEIRDTGSGMAAKDLEHVFEPFFTTKRMGEGTGLGLAICHGIITQLGGRISVESVSGHGTTFSIWLPAATSAGVAKARLAPEPDERRRAGGHATASRREILVVDDEPRIAESFMLLLGGQHHVRTVSTGRAALELCATEKFDVIFCDLRMPEMGGYEVYQSLRAADCEAQAKRIVFMTGSLTTTRDLQASVHEDVAILRKPFSTKELNAVLEDCLSASSSAQR